MKKRRTKKELLVQQVRDAAHLLEQESRYGGNGGFTEYPQFCEEMLMRLLPKLTTPVLHELLDEIQATRNLSDERLAELLRTKPMYM